MGKIVDKLLKLLGEGTVFIPEDLGKKGCFFDDWQYLTWEMTQSPETELVWRGKEVDGEKPIRKKGLYINELSAVENRGGNLSVLLKDGLCAIDIDSDAEVEPFLKLNPGLRRTLITKGHRGVQIWVRCKHDVDLEFHGIPSWPSLSPLKGKEITVDNKKTNSWGEWRAWKEGSGCKSTIYGKHPKGMQYSFINEASPISIYFRDILWPEYVTLPWEAENLELLVKRWGPPWTADDDGQIEMPTEAFWAAWCALKNHLLYEAQEERFYVYEHDTGVWRRRIDDEVKAIVSDEMMAASREEVFKSSQLGSKGLGENWKRIEIGALVALQTNKFRSNGRLQAITQLLKGLVAKRGAFDRDIGVVHAQNGMVDLRRVKDGHVTLEAFSPRWFSRNQIPVPFEPGKSCPELMDRLLCPGYTADEIKMLQRWFGQCVLGQNKQQVMMIIVGNAGGGKSTIIKLFQQFIGVDNVMELRTKQLDERFEMYFYVGKTFLSGVDVDGNFLQYSSASALKKLTGDDLLHAEGKGAKDAISFRGNLNIGISCNGRLKVKLKSDHDAWRRRLCVAQCKSPKPKEKIDQMEKYLIEREGSGIFNWALGGAVDVLNGTPIRHSSALDKKVDDLINESDSVKVYASACLEKARGCSLPSKHIYSKYLDYAESRNWEALGESEFLRAIRPVMSELFSANLSSSVKDPENNRDCKGYRGVTWISVPSTENAVEAENNS